MLYAVATAFAFGLRPGACSTPAAMRVSRVARISSMLPRSSRISLTSSSISMRITLDLRSIAEVSLAPAENRLENIAKKLENAENMVEYLCSGVVLAELPLLPRIGGVLFVFDLAPVKNINRTYFIFFQK